MYSRTQIPVLIGADYHVCEASINEEGDTVTVTMSAKGSKALDLAAILTSGEPMAIKFVPVPVNPRTSTLQGED